MPTNSERRRPGRNRHDYDEYSDDSYDRRPRRRDRNPSKDRQKLDDAEAGLARRDKHDYSPPRTSHRARSVDALTKRPARRRHDSYTDDSDDSDRDDRRRSKRGRGSGRAGRSSSRGPGRQDKLRDRERSIQRQESGSSTNTNQVIAAVATAALAAGAAEAWRMRNDKSTFKRKSIRVATAAAGAAAIAVAKTPRSSDGRKSQPKGGALKATLGGLLVNRLANGGKKS